MLDFNLETYRNKHMKIWLNTIQGFVRRRKNVNSLMKMKRCVTNDKHRDHLIKTMTNNRLRAKTYSNSQQLEIRKTNCLAIFKEMEKGGL
jgi:hypothetical protein